MARIDPTARVADGARLGTNVEVGPYCVIGANVELADDVKVIAQAHLAGHTRVGPRTVIHPFATVGTLPQSVHYKGEPSRLSIGADCIIREYANVNVGTAGGGMETVVGDRCFIMTGAHIAHDCKLGNDVLLVNHATLGGHCELGEFAVLSGLATLHPHVRIGAYSILGGMTGSIWDVLPFAAVFGLPGELRGVNVAGMKRRGFSREAIQAVRGAYRMLFSGSGPWPDRAERLAEAFPGEPNVARIVEFLRVRAKRPLLIPSGELAEET